MSKEKIVQRPNEDLGTELGTVPITDLFQYPLMQAIFGRRSRRFGLGMELPSGPLAFKSRSKPYPLTKLEQAILIASGTGVSGWTFGVPFGPRQPTAHAHFTQRFTGRTIPTASGIWSRWGLQSQYPRSLETQRRGQAECYTLQ
jgi:hypothetical protein